MLEGNVCALLAAKDHVNTTARTVAIREGETIDAPALRALLEQIDANSRAGGWRALKRAR